MKHLGDITKIKGCNAPVVDCIIGGSPCQDLSVAGKRAGLAGERSGLYMEQIRIIKEMRHSDELRGRTGESIRPRYMVWENVPGAFSSNKGQDFAAVLEEAIKVAEPEAPDVPVPEKGWPTSGCIVGDNWSVAWRVLDAQFWGVPQRRRRIALVADFGGQSAPEILFIRKGVSRDLDDSEQERKATSRNAKSSTGADDRAGVPYTLKIRSGVEVDSGGKSAGKGALIQTDKTGTLSTVQDQYLFQPVYGFQRQLSGVEIQEDSAPTLLAAAGESGNNKPCVAYCLQGGGATSQNSKGDGVNEDITFTLNAVDRHAVVYGISPYHSNCMKSDNPHSGYYEADTARTLDALQCGYPGCNQGGMAVVEPITYEWHSQDLRAKEIKDDTSPTLSAGMGMGGASMTTPMLIQEMAVVEPVTYQKVTGPLMANSHPGSYTGQDAFSDMLVAGPVAEEPIVIDRAFFNQGQNAQYDPQYYEDGTVPTLISRGPCAIAHGVDCRNATEYEEQTGTLQAKSNGGISYNLNNVVRVRYIVRRLTPLECERLQGFPDGWTDIGEWVDTNGKKHKEADSPRYKALGNSIAIPPWKWVLKRLCACYERDATMASLFDGIGGFPYIWEQLNGKGSCLWASEIEEFPIAVTKVRFGECSTESIEKTDS